jgi:SAM-dependent methyltransferase
MNHIGQIAASAHPYVLGHSDREIERLIAQAQLIDPITERFLREAGLAPGMRVLDVGTGAGDVAFLAADIVGADGAVVGVDRVSTALEVAQARAAAKSLGSVTFINGDPAAMMFDRPFDAVIGRYFLQFQQDPASMVRKLAGQLSPGGLIAFHEIDWGGVGSFPAVPTFERCCRWGLETMRLHGTESRMGAKLHATFVGAGLPPPTMRLEAPIGGVPVLLPWLHMFKEFIRTLLPEMERWGVATAAEVGIETLVERISTEANASSSVIYGHSQIGAWVRG